MTNLPVSWFRRPNFAREGGLTIRLFFAYHNTHRRSEKDGPAVIVMSKRSSPAVGSLHTSPKTKLRPFDSSRLDHRRVRKRSTHVGRSEQCLNRRKVLLISGLLYL